MTGRRKHYGLWLRDPNPKRPRTTAFRADRDEEDEENSSHRQDVLSKENHYIHPNILQGIAVFLRHHNPTRGIQLRVIATLDSSASEVEISDSEENNEECQGGNEALGTEGGDVEGEAQMEGPQPAGAGRGGRRQHRPDLDEPIYPGLTTTRFECLLLCFHLMMRNGLSYTGLTHLLKMINCIFGDEVVPESGHAFDRIFKGSFTVEVHFYCSGCMFYLGEQSSFPVDKDVVCSSCDARYTVAELETSSFFIHILILQQLKSYFEMSENISELLKYRFQRTSTDGEISDIFDGAKYKELMKEGGFLSDSRNVSISFNTDSAPVFKSAKNSLWPVQFSLQDIPPKERFSSWNCMVAGLWFGKEEPDMTVFLTPFVSEVQKLYHTGFEWTDSSGSVNLSKVIVLSGTFDSVGKPKVQNLKQFNGYYGCPYCVHPGIIIPEHVQVRYLLDGCPLRGTNYDPLYKVTKVDPVTEEEEEVNVIDRTNEGIPRDMKEVSERDEVNFTVRGVKGESILVALFYFDLVFGFNLDYLHAVLIGVTKSVTNLMFDSTSHREKDKYYIRDSISAVDKRLKSITPPSNLSRRPRSLKERNLWKANEWRAWLLYYSLVCLKDILKPAYYKHHCLLVTSISILLQDKISTTELDQAANHLNLYVYNFQTLYGEKFMSFNVHLLLHLSKCVFLWGPLWCFSAFGYESGNGRLVRLVKGTRSVVGQIAKKYVMTASIPEVVSLYAVKDSTIECCSEMMSFRIVKNVKKVDDATLLSLPVHKPLSDKEKATFARQKLDKNRFSYERMIVKGVKYHSKVYRRQGDKSNDSVVRFVDGTFGEIERIFEVSRDNQDVIYVLVRL